MHTITVEEIEVPRGNAGPRMLMFVLAGIGLYREGKVYYECRTCYNQEPMNFVKFSR